VDQPPLPQPPGSPPPEPPSESAKAERHPVLAVLVAAAALLAMTVIGLVLTRPVPCADQSFLSERYGYCVETPAGWDEADAGSLADRFVIPGRSATVAVVASEVDASTGTLVYLERVRSVDESAGFNLGDAKTMTVDGEEAAYFDAAGDAPGASFAVREVVLVRDGVAWRITFSDVRDEFDEHFAAFGTFLDSWQFR
jgi:hypothetical protein